MHHSKSNGSVLSPTNQKKKVPLGKGEAAQKKKPAASKKLKSAEFENQGTTALQVENDHLRALVEKMSLEKDVAESRAKDVEMLQGQLERAEQIRQEQDEFIKNQQEQVRQQSE